MCVYLLGLSYHIINTRLYLDGDIYVQWLHLGTNGFMQPISLDIVTMTCMNESIARHVYTSGHINITIVLGEFGMCYSCTTAGTLHVE